MTTLTLLALTTPLPLHPATHHSTGGEGWMQHLVHTFVGAIGWYSGRAVVEQFGLGALAALAVGYLVWRLTKGRKTSRTKAARS